MLCETENLNFTVYSMIDRHSYEQVHLKVEPKSFSYEFLYSRDPLYVSQATSCLFYLRKRDKNTF